MNQTAAPGRTPSLRSIVHVTNLFVAVFGGLALLLPLTAPFNMMMSEWRSIVDVLMAATICGGLPLACVLSIVFSKRLFSRGRSRTALFVASLVPMLVGALVAWGVVSN